MTDYGRGSVLGAATALPATSGAGLLLIGHADPIIVSGLFVVSVASFIVLLASISRYLINTKRLN